MLQKIFIFIEWFVGLASMGLVSGTFLLIMFTDDPAFMLKLTPLQKIVFDTQGLWMVAVIGGVLLSFVLHFFIKSVPWSHIVGVIGVFGIICSLIFYSAY
jgi:hypothetical protein